MKGQNVEHGERVEALFAYEATVRGFRVSKPITTLRYDFIVDSGEKLSRVQVKSTLQKAYGYIKYTITLASNRNRAYLKSDVDFIAVYIEPVKSWYILPSSKIENKKGLSFYPGAKRNLSQYEKYREMWDQLL